MSVLENKPKNLPADQRRAVTVEAVIELAAEQNPSEITTAAIAKRMNLTQGALFRHFPSKDAIWQAVMEWVAEHLLARVDKAIAAEKSPLLALESVFMTHIDFVASHPGVPRMLFGQLQHSEDTAPKRMARTLIGRYAERVSALIVAGKTQGELEAGIDTSAATTLFIGTVQGLVMQSLLADDVNLMRTQAPGAFAIFKRGIEAIR
jgi:AcrR family transcriptional regulator